MDQPDLSPVPTDSTLSTLSQLGEDFYDAESEVLRLEALLKRAKTRRDNIQLTEIPEFLYEVGITEFATKDLKVKVSEMLQVTPKKENRPLVLAMLEKQGAGNLIKSLVTVQFNRGQDEKAKKIIALLREHDLAPKQEKKVESQTLKKHVKDRLEAGKVVDMDLFGAKQFKKASFVDGAPEPPVFDGE